MVISKQRTLSHYYLWFQVVSACLVIVLTRVALANGSGMTNSPHDFSQRAQSDAGSAGKDEICNSCHVPHDLGRDMYQDGLLWNHAKSEATYTTYASAVRKIVSQPSGTSKMCLSCHDGTIAIDDYGAVTSNGTTLSNSFSYISSKLSPAYGVSRTHPVGVEYVYDPFDRDGLRNPSSALGDVGTISDVLDNGKVVCSSCHDVHNNVSLSGSRLLRAPMKTSQGAASGLCLACHKK